MSTRSSHSQLAATMTAALALALAPGALLVTVTHPLPAQQPAQGTGRISGIVTSDGQPVPNAQVVVVGTRLGTQTDAQGRYTITGVPAGSYTLRIQRIGFAAQTRTVTVAAGQVASADFGLTQLAVTLQEVRVQVGYTNEARRDVSAAVTTVSGNDIRDQKVATVEEALRGRAPGVQIAASGQPGRPAQIVVRGQNGFGNPSPLYVVDGMYIGTQNPNINPDDIQTITILKDAAAAAQYGAQASNGVIVITTRRGSAGQSQFAVNAYYGFQSVPKRIDVAGTTQFQQVFRQAFANAGITDTSAIPLGVRAPTTVNTNWQDALFQTGAIQNYNVQASGGTETASYLISGSAFDQKGTVFNTGFRRYSLRVNSEARRGILTLGENLALSQGNQSAFPNGIFAGVALPLIDVVSLLPTIPVRDPGNPGGYGYGSAANPNYGTNPVAALQSNYNRFRSNQVLGTAYAQVRLVRNLNYRLNLGLNYNDSLSTIWNSSTQLRYLTPVALAFLRQATPNAQQLLYENLLTYDGSLGGGTHRLNAVVGQTSQNNSFRRLEAYRQGFSNEALQEINAGATSGSSNAGFYIPFRTNAFLARVNYALADRYLFSLSGRRDCSSRFSPGNRCGNFGAGSIGWVASEEAFFKAIPLLGRADLLKFRASTGVLGDQNIGDLAYVAPIAQNINYLNASGAIIPGATQIRLANTNLRWQRNRSTDVGLDLGLLGNTLSITADYYRNDADQLLVAAAIPPSLASASFPVVNAGKVRNAGFEFGATHRLTRGAFGLNSTLTLTTTANRVLSLGNGGQPLFAGVAQVARTSVGQPIGTFFLKRTCGIFQNAAAVAGHTSLVRNPDGSTRTVVIQPDAQPGDQCFVDANRDGTINDQDRVNVGPSIPKLTTGLFFEPRYKAFDFGINFRGAFGNKVYNAVRLATERTNGLSNIRSDFTPWTEQNRSTTTPRAVFGASYSATINSDPVSDRWLERGDYLRIQNLIIGYTLPSAALQRLRVAGGTRPRVYVNAQNVYTFTGYSGYDPEVLGFGDPLARGVDDGFIYPNPRQVTFGIDFRF